jgi:hypothetical protein
VTPNLLLALVAALLLMRFPSSFFGQPRAARQ